MKTLKTRHISRSSQPMLKYLKQIATESLIVPNNSLGALNQHIKNQQNKGGNGRMLV